MSKLLVSLVAVLVFVVPALWASVSLPFGEEEGKVAFFNANNHPDDEEPIPLGPLAFRVAGSEFWVADSVAGRVYRLDATGKVLSTIVAATGSIILLEDLALARGADGAVSSIWVLSGGEQLVKQFSPDGKLLQSFGGRGDAPGQFVQMHRLEVGASGRVFIADKGRQMISIFSPEGKFERELPWQWSGLALDSQENLCRLLWDDAAQITRLELQPASGQPVKTIDLALGKHFDPELWFVDEKGQAYVTFNPPEGFQGKFKFAICGTDGKPVLVTDLKPPLAMNRYIDRGPDDALFLGVADYTDAPKGEFRIEPWSPK